MKVIIHGGFFSESSKSSATKMAKQNSLKKIISLAYEFLTANSALKTVVYAIEQLENDPLFNAGTGSQIQSDGKIRMSASLMDGVTKKFSGVINIENVKNPIRVAEKLFEYDDRVLGADGATAFARKNNFEFFDPEILQRRKEYEKRLSAKSGSALDGKTKPLSTVGCVAFDPDGNIAAATSTGGKGFEMPGRISDSATTAGNYANANCGVSCTGVGEDIVSAAMASAIVTRVSDGLSLKEACKKTFAELKEIDGFAGVIAIDKKGNIFHMDSHPTMVFASFDGKDLEIFQ